MTAYHISGQQGSSRESFQVKQYVTQVENYVTQNELHNNQKSTSINTVLWAVDSSNKCTFVLL